MIPIVVVDCIDGIASVSVRAYGKRSSGIGQLRPFLSPGYSHVQAEVFTSENQAHRPVARCEHRPHIEEPFGALDEEKEPNAARLQAGNFFSLLQNAVDRANGL